MPKSVAASDELLAAIAEIARPSRGHGGGKSPGPVILGIKEVKFGRAKMPATGNVVSVKKRADGKSTKLISLGPQIGRSRQQNKSGWGHKARRLRPIGERSGKFWEWTCSNEECNERIRKVVKRELMFAIDAHKCGKESE